MDTNYLPVDIDLDIDPLSPPSSVLPPLKTYSRVPRNKQFQEESEEYEDIEIVLPKPKRGRPSKKKHEDQTMAIDDITVEGNNKADLQKLDTDSPKPRRGRSKKNPVSTKELDSSESVVSLPSDNRETSRRASLRKRGDVSKALVKTSPQKDKTSTQKVEKGLVPEPQRTSTPIEKHAEYQCEICPRVFKTLQGARIHSASCKKSTFLKTPPSSLKKEVIEENTPEIIIPDTAENLVNDVINNSVENLVTNNNGNGVNETFTLENMSNIDKDYSFPLDTDIVDHEVGADKCHCCGEDLQTAHSGGEFQCADCSKLFKLKSSLERHRRVVHNEGETFECPECNARCPDKGTLARHMYTHTGLKPYSCPICKKEFSRKYHLVRHNMQTGCDGSERPTFPCQVCGRIFNRKDNLREHLRAHAGQTKRKKKYNCEYCSKEFLGTTLLHIHKRSHTGEKPYGCDFCTKHFPSSGAMKKHRRKHTGERPYECKQCLARFAAKETLNRHMRTHTGVKPHTCQYCGKSFIQASQLRAHIFHHSGVTVQGENGFTCKTCGKAFNRRTRLQLHVKYVHEGAIPFTCETCNKTFVRKEDLARHHILHSGIKAHKCPICEKCFAMKSSLKIHLLTHTKEPPRSCDECGRAFIRQDCLLRHMRTKHRDMLEEIMAEAEKKKLQQQLLAAANEAALELPDPDEPKVLTEEALAEAIKELLTLLVDETTLKAFGFPDAPVDCLLEAVIRRCSHQPAGYPEMLYGDRLRENAKLLFTVVIDDSAVKTLLNNQTVDEVILHVLRLAKS